MEKTVESKFIDEFVAKADFKAQHNDKFIDVKKGKKYSNIDKFWLASLITEKVIERRE